MTSRYSFAVALLVLAAGCLPPPGASTESGRLSSPSCKHNNTFGCATPLEVGPLTTQRSGTPMRGDFDEKDFYRLSVSEAGVLDVAIQPLEGQTQLLSSLYDSDRRLVEEVSIASRGSRVAYSAAVRPGTYFLEVERVRGAGPYEAQVTLDREDAFEVNDTFAEAKPVELGESYRIKSKPAEDPDYFVFESGGADSLEVVLQSVPRELKPVPAAFDERQQLIAELSSRRTKAGMDVQWQFAAPPGKGYLLIRPRGRRLSSDATYTLILRRK